MTYSPRVRWEDAQGAKHSMSPEAAAEVLKSFYDQWPGGLDEIEAAIQHSSVPQQIVPWPTMPVCQIVAKNIGQKCAAWEGIGALDVLDVWRELASVGGTVDGSQKEYAENYAWLRKQNWFEGKLCVVLNPKQQLKPGTNCPSVEWLDKLIKEERNKEKP